MKNGIGKPHVALLVFLLLAKPVVTMAGSSDFYDKREHGWYWYEQKKSENETESVDGKEINSESSEISPREVLEAQKKELDEAMAASIVNPNPENYQRFLAILTKVNEQGQRFSEGFKKAIWTMPEYDYTLTGRPIDPQAIVEHNVLQNEKNNQRIYDIASKKGILYFFRSDCPYCKRFSPILKRYSEQFGFTVIPISLDGVGSEEYPYPKTSYSIQEKLNVSVVPATFLVDPDSNSVATIGYGFNDWTALQSKIIYADDQLSGSQPKQAGEP